MVARAAVLNSPEIVKLLRARFVPLAVDNVATPNLTAAEKEFLSDKGGKFCTQGMSVFTAGGKVLAMGGGFEPGPVKKMLEDALARFKPEEASPAALSLGKGSRDSLPQPPKGGLILFVTWKVLGGEEFHGDYPGDQKYVPLFRDSLGVDRLWVRRDEAAALARGDFPESLKRRMRRLPMLQHAKAIDLSLREGRVSGSVRPESADRGYRAGALGFLEAREGKVSRLDLALVGPYTGRGWDCGFGAGLSVVPKGKKVPLAVLFTLADPRDDLAKVLPHGSNHPDYLR